MIQRVSQRMILALAAFLKPSCNLYVRDFSQLYVQSTNLLNLQIIANSPKEIADSLPQKTVRRILKPLYGNPEAGTHWHNTYIKHDQEKLSMSHYTYDHCLFYVVKANLLGIVGMQTDDTLFVTNDAFYNLENEQLAKAGIAAKPVQTLSKVNSLIFNG